MRLLRRPHRADKGRHDIIEPMRNELVGVHGVALIDVHPIAVRSTYDMAMQAASRLTIMHGA